MKKHLLFEVTMGCFFHAEIAYLIKFKLETTKKLYSKKFILFISSILSIKDKNGSSY